MKIAMAVRLVRSIYGRQEQKNMPHCPLPIGAYLGATSEDEEPVAGAENPVFQRKFWPIFAPRHPYGNKERYHEGYTEHEVRLFQR